MAEKEHCAPCDRDVTKSQMGAHVASKSHQGALLKLQQGGLVQPPTGDPAPPADPAPTISPAEIASRTEPPKIDETQEPKGPLDEEDDDFDPDKPKQFVGAHGESERGDGESPERMSRDREIKDPALRIIDAPNPNGAFAMPTENVAATYVDLNAPRRRPSKDDSDGAQAWDEIDVLIGAPPSERTEKVTFEWCKDARGYRLRFSRHYFTRGVLLDRFASVNDLVRREVTEKAAAIRKYNAQCASPEERVGYLPMVLGVPLTVPQADAALRRQVVQTIIDYVATDDSLRQGSRVVDMSAQVL